MAKPNFFARCSLTSNSSVDSLFYFALSRLRSILLLGLCIVSVQVVANDLPPGTTPVPRTIDYPWMSVATWQRMHAEDQLVAAHDQVDVLFFGDSITAGWDWQVWQDNFAPLNAANFGIGGDHTGNMLWRLQHGDIGQLQPKVIVLLAGVNNWGFLQESPSQVFAGVKAVVTQLQLAFPNAKILLNGVFPFEQSGQSPMRKWVKDLNKKIATLNNNKTIFVKNYGDLFLEKDNSIAPAIMADFLHPTAQGYTIWAKAMKPDILQLLNNRK